MTTDTQPSDAAALTNADFDTLEAILDDLRTRDDETPQWEFCEGFMAALLCCRRVITPAEYWPELLGMDVPQGQAVPALFRDLKQYQQFMNLWQRRMDAVATALDLPVASLDDERAYLPKVMDLRGEVAVLPPDERAELGDTPLPSLALIWTLGFLYAVESWPKEWTLPRDRDTSSAISAALQNIMILVENDNDPPTVSTFSEDGPPSVSQRRADNFSAAIWAVYDLYQLWHSMGPQVETVRLGDKTGRNDPCPCGSGKKFKKCCGA